MIRNRFSSDVLMMMWRNALDGRSSPWRIALRRLVTDTPNLAAASFNLYARGSFFSGVIVVVLWVNNQISTPEMGFATDPG